MKLYPFEFDPIIKERVWGGRNLASLYQKQLPSDAPMGESWEITDRPEGVSVINNGALAGKSLRWLMENHADELLGRCKPLKGRFPLLVKILDAAQKLSLQVHPPAALAERLNGEPKTEMWYIAHAQANSDLFVGLKASVTKEQFEARLAEGSVAECFHRIPVDSGDAMFLPSGRVHAIGAGNVIFEIQQNSDTTYRVYDWDRLGLDGQPRELHVDASLACIDFKDKEPTLIATSADAVTPGTVVCPLVDDPCFSVDHYQVESKGDFRVSTQGRPTVLGLIQGEIDLMNDGQPLSLSGGAFCLIPASSSDCTVVASERAQLLVARPGIS